MHLQNPEILPAVRLRRFSAVGDGMHVEVSRSESENEPFLTFREDETLGMQVVLHYPDRDLVFPLAELKRAIAEAEAEAHQESFYDSRSNGEQS